MICKKCNAEVMDSAKFCTNCGSKLEEEVEKINEVQNSVKSNTVEKVEKENTSNKKLPVSITSIIVALMYSTCLVINAAGMTGMAFKTASDYAEGGWAVICLPILLPVFCFAHFIGTIVATINIFVRKIFMLIISLIISLISIGATFALLSGNLTINIFAYISIIIGMAITILLLIKLIKKDI